MVETQLTMMMQVLMEMLTRSQEVVQRRTASSGTVMAEVPSVGAVLRKPPPPLVEVSQRFVPLAEMGFEPQAVGGHHVVLVVDMSML
jgi:hypothetical protein